MKLYFHIFFSLMVFFTCNRNVMLWADYRLNQDFYESLCTNADKPELDCHGKCQMASGAEDPEKDVFHLYNGQSFDFVTTSETLTLLDFIVPESDSKQFTFSDLRMILGFSMTPERPPSFS